MPVATPFLVSFLFPPLSILIEPLTISSFRNGSSPIFPSSLKINFPSWLEIAPPEYDEKLLNIPECAPISTVEFFATYNAPPSALWKNKSLRSMSDESSLKPTTLLSNAAFSPIDIVPPLVYIAPPTLPALFVVNQVSLPKVTAL